MSQVRRDQLVILRRTLLDLEAKGAQALKELRSRPEPQSVQGPSGAVFEVSVDAFWDKEPLDLDLYVEVSVTWPDGLLPRRKKSGLVVDPYSNEIVRYENFPGK